MPLSASPEHSQTGFTLLELSVVLVIVAMVIGGGIALGSARVEQARVEATRSRVAMVENALRSFAELNKRLPCPADGRLDAQHPDLGKEADYPGDCAGGTVEASWSSGHVAGGAVPFIALGLPRDAMYDAWGRRLTYAVDLRMTRESAVRRNPLHSGCGGIAIADGNGTVQIANAVYTLLSHGVDGHGAWLPNGTVMNSSNTHPSTLSNASHSGVFRMQGYEASADNPRYRFDDMVFFATRAQMLLTSDRQGTGHYGISGNAMPGGWLYVPETTLPDGRLVQAFEVMQHEASQPDGDGLPRSEAGRSPWNTATFTQARQACQRLGGDNASGAPHAGSLRQWDIITESQWLAIANQTAMDSRNWVGGCYGETALHAGHRDSFPASALAGGANDAEGYAGTGNSAGDVSTSSRSQRRTLHLPGGSVIWDFSGNNAEWSYCDLPGHCLPNGQTDLSTYTGGSITLTGDYDYSGMTHLIPPENLNNSQHTGRLNAYHASQQNGVLRGGMYNASDSGLFSASIGRLPASTAGFRCARHSKPEPFYPSNLGGLEIWYDASDPDGDWKEEGAAEGGVDATAGCAKTTTPVNNGCLRVWRNKAGNGKYHARSRRLNGAASGTDNNAPTIRLSAINGKPAVNFAAAAAQWLDTHHGVAGDPVSDDGLGFDFAGRGEFTFIIVANASEWDAILSGTDDVALWWPHFVIFPFNINNFNTNNDYVFLVDNHMAGSDAGNTFCRTNGVLLGALDPLCLSDPIGKANYACAQMGGIANPSRGLSRNETHIATGIFLKGADAGLSAYVDGSGSHMTDSSVRAANDVIAGRQCLLGALLRFLKIKLNIGMMRTDPSIRTVGNVAEIIVYNRALSAPERKRVEQYLADKYGLSYPVNH